MAGNGKYQTDGASALTLSPGARAIKAAEFIGPPTPPSGSATGGSIATPFISTAIDNGYTFLIGVAKPTGSLNPGDGTPIFGFDSRYTPVNMEVPPARRSFHEKQGQAIPGVEAGFLHYSTSNLVALNVPAYRVIYQNLGIKKECVEFVGAFCGFDNYDSTKDVLVNSSSITRTNNAWNHYLQLKALIQPAREMMMQLRWSGSSEYEVSYLPLTNYHGYITELEIAYATEQRVYYKIKMELNNKEDLLASARPDNKSYTLTGVPLPPQNPVEATPNKSELYAAKTAESIAAADVLFGASANNTPAQTTANQVISGASAFTDLASSPSGVADANNKIKTIDDALKNDPRKDDPAFRSQANQARQNLSAYLTKASTIQPSTIRSQSALRAQ